MSNLCEKSLLYFKQLSLHPAKCTGITIGQQASPAIPDSPQTKNEKVTSALLRDLRVGTYYYNIIKHKINREDCYHLN